MIRISIKYLKHLTHSLLKGPSILRLGNLPCTFPILSLYSVIERGKNENHKVNSFRTIFAAVGINECEVEEDKKTSGALKFDDEKLCLFSGRGGAPS
ncbi:hypothetical protein CEXT_173041 [Caerostris extrusa]|uniref:Uncharacterized protein n=1 Tax=Caerostris extrusa TaxID=172846 RepID=A0AAV4P6F3_CAEEX|nr:hypothetical protein CEXT_173041 [Caerostris extrusa]